MEPLKGTERFCLGEKELNISVSDFWGWSCSDLSDNIIRGLLAEFIVHSAVASVGSVRANWDSYDIVTQTGLRIEVKSSAYLQSWSPEDVFSKISFDIAPKHVWDGSTYAPNANRSGDLYVFCVFTAHTRDVLPLDLSYLDFYVLPTSVLDDRVPEQKRITLSSLLKLEPTKCDYKGLGTVIENARSRHEAS